jgi:glycosyltransferase involved in cell wall biosynthesis
MLHAELISIIVPTFEEAATIERVLRKVDSIGLDAEVIVVDDGSTDGTAKIVERLAGELDNLRLLRHEYNRGKGAAVRTALAASCGDIVVIQDADLEYDPTDIPRLVEPLRLGVADAVYGTRLRGGQPQRAHLFWHYVGNRFLSLLTNVLFNTTLSDIEVGYKAFRGDLIRSLPLRSDRFGFEPEVTAGILRRDDVRLYEVPIAYYGRSYAEGKKITWRDGVAAVFHLVRFRFRRWPGNASPDAGSERPASVDDQAQADARPQPPLERAPER